MLHRPSNLQPRIVSFFFARLDEFSFYCQKWSPSTVHTAHLLRANVFKREHNFHEKYKSSLIIATESQRYEIVGICKLPVEVAGCREATRQCENLKWNFPSTAYVFAVAGDEFLFRAHDDGTLFGAMSLYTHCPVPIKFNTQNWNEFAHGNLSTFARSSVCMSTKGSVCAISGGCHNSWAFIYTTSLAYGA